LTGRGARESRVRIDELLTRRGLAPSRTKARALVMAGAVYVDGRRVDKPGRLVDAGADVTVKERQPYVSRGGQKLAAFLDEKGVDVRGLVVLDVGSSTGGFTDCLLKRGAERVHAVDVGKGIIDWGLRQDERVHLIEGRNIRYLEPSEVGEKVDLVVIDVSFISLEKVLPVIRNFLKAGGRVLALVKPQFEVGRRLVGKGGIVRDEAARLEALKHVRAFAEDLGYRTISEMECPVRGARGNVEYWLYLELEK